MSPRGHGRATRAGGTEKNGRREARGGRIGSGASIRWAGQLRGLALLLFLLASGPLATLLVAIHVLSFAALAAALVRLARLSRTSLSRTSALILISLTELPFLSRHDGSFRGSRDARQRSTVQEASQPVCRPGDARNAKTHRSLV
jgi:hypothetical protein